MRIRSGAHINIQSPDLVSELISYLEEKLPYFEESEIYKVNISSASNEDDISEQICNYLLQVGSRKFTFIRESRQGSRSKADIAVYDKAYLVYTLEAKILPIPMTGNRKEYEYVFGEGAGIQRFKDEKHGRDKQMKLIPRNGMLV